MNLLFYSKIIKPSNIINQLLPNLWIFIAHIISTIILLFFLTKFVYNPFKKMMHFRKDKINDLLQDAANKQAKANINKKETFNLLNKAKIEANNIIISAKNEAENKKNNILELAKKEFIKINKQAKKEIIKEKEKSKDDIKKLIINTSFEIASKLLEKEINKENNQKLIDNFIKNLE